MIQYPKKKKRFFKIFLYIYIIFPFALMASISFYKKSKEKIGFCHF